MITKAKREILKAQISMKKNIALLLAGYFLILTILYFTAKGDKFSPSNFGAMAMIITPIYLFLFVLFIYFNKPKDEK